MGYVSSRGCGASLVIPSDGSVLVFGAIALIVIGVGMGGYKNAAQQAMSRFRRWPADDPRRINRLLFSYTFIPLSAIFHILSFPLTAEKMNYPADRDFISALYSGHLAPCVSSA
jgi:dipeptide/tripeptide permease